MTRTRLTVETPFGTVTRTTARPYRFVVVSFGQSETFLRRRHAEGVAYNTKLAAGYRKAEASGGMDTPDPRDRGTWPAETWAEWAANAEAKAAAPFVMPRAGLMVHGWSGSAAGAMKMAQDAERYSYLNITTVAVGA